MLCPKCLYHIQPIYTIDISPKTNQRWRVERCPHCSYAFDLELEREYQRKRKLDIEDKRRVIRPDDPKSGWMFGL